MQKNMGLIDRIIRCSIAMIIVALYFLGYLHGVVAIILLILSGVFILTSFLGWCPLYSPLGLSTRKKD